MGISPLFFKVLFVVLAVVGFSWFLLVGILESGGTSTSTLTTDQSSGNLKQVEVTGREKLVVHSGLDLNYMSKRRVPNGPDPIHNRRAGNSRQPPGQA